MVECQLPKLDVAGSSPVSRSRESVRYEFYRKSATPDTPFVHAQRKTAPVDGITPLDDSHPQEQRGRRCGASYLPIQEDVIVDSILGCQSSSSALNLALNLIRVI